MTKPKNLISLLQKAQKGCAESRNQLIKDNQWLVMYTLKYVPPRFTSSHEDIMQEGMIALNKAINLWDPSRGEFSTVAVLYIKQAIRKFLWQDNIFCTPYHSVKEVTNLPQEEGQFMSQYGRKPSQDELANQMGLSVARLETIQKLCRMRNRARRTLTEGAMETKWYIDCPMIHMEKQEMLDKIKKAMCLAKISQRNKTIMWRRLNGEHLQCIGNDYGVTKERIRQIFNRCMIQIKCELKNV